jgi:preprotein translocase subunit YajC
MSSHLIQVGLVFHGLTLAATTKKSSGSSATLLLLIGFGLVVYLFVLRPRSRKMRAAQQQTQGAGVGDEVMMASGIIGRVTSIEGDRAMLEIAPDIEIEIVRRAISTVLVKSDEELPLDIPPDPGSEEYLHDHEVHGEDDDDENVTDDDDGDPDVHGETSDEDSDPAYVDSSSKPGLPGPGSALDLGGEGPSHS